MKDNLDMLWAKRPRTDDTDEPIIPLKTHLKKTMNTANKLFKTWLPPLIKHKINVNLLIFLAYSHDIGKASPVFQIRKSSAPQMDERIRKNIEAAGFLLKDMYPEPTKTRHELISHAVLKRHGLDDSICVIVGGHHGLPPSQDKIDKLNSYKSNCGFDNEKWIEAQDELFYKGLEIAKLSLRDIQNIIIERPNQVLYSGIIILSDWLASSEKNIMLPSIWKPENSDNIYNHRFNISNPRPIQQEFINLIKKGESSGIYIIEAPMGEGKTEAALAAAEILAHKIGCRGLYFALPSQATSNAMLKRVKDWIESFEQHDDPLSIRLSHGKAELNEEYEGIKIADYQEGDEPAVTVHSWLTGSKKGMLADFTVGTIDHVLMAGLKQKHLALRHLGLANKVLIIDECHAYDIYMESYLLIALRWLGAYGVPVIILSATLPSDRRTELVRAYLNEGKRFGKGEKWAKTTSYPLITYINKHMVESLPITTKTQGSSVRVNINKIENHDLIDKLENILIDGGCAGIICNTVKKAQKIFTDLSARFGTSNVELLHSGFIYCDREKREADLLIKLGKNAGSNRPCKNIVVGTQVFEQSLDIDFDVMFTDLCPVDLLLQRIGRLHRHAGRTRPIKLTNPTCYIMGVEWGSFDKGSVYVYGDYLLMRTCAVLQKMKFINIPDDIPRLVSYVYDMEHDINVPEEFEGDYQEAINIWEYKINDRKESAKSFQIKGSVKDKTILGWLDSALTDNEKEGEAAVRDGLDTIEVIIIQQLNGQLHFLPWLNKYGDLSPYITPNKEQAKALVRCSVRLPTSLSYEISNVIRNIESDMYELKEAWYQSYWLNGSLVLIVDDEQKTSLGNHTICYDELLGLYIVD